MSEASSLAGRKHERVAGSRTVNGDTDPHAPIVTLTRLATAHEVCRHLRDRPYLQAIDELAFELQRIFEARIVLIRDGAPGPTMAIAPPGIYPHEWAETLDRLHPARADAAVRCFSVSQGDRWPPTSNVGQMIVVPLEQRTGGALFIGVEQAVAPSNEELRCFELLGERVAAALQRLALKSSGEADGNAARRPAEPASSDFVSIAAHELRTPLTPITMLLQTLERKARIGVVDIDAIVRTRKQVHRLSLMISDLLDLTRLHENRLTLTPVLVELRSALAQAVRHFSENDSKRHVELVAPDDGIVIVADEPRLVRSLSGLIEHIARITSVDDAIRVSLGCDGGRATILVAAERAAMVHPGDGIRALGAPRAQPLAIAVLLAEAILARFGATLFIGDGRGDNSRVELTLPLVDSTSA